MRKVAILLALVLAMLGVSAPAFATAGDRSSVAFSVPGGTVHAGWVSDAKLAANTGLYAQLGIRRGHSGPRSRMAVGSLRHLERSATVRCAQRCTGRA